MFSTKTNILQLTSLLLQYGITQAVVCPGSRNSAVVHTLHAAGIQCFSITDERSAGFFAIGLIEANGGKPVAVCVTSGSAVLNLAPAVSEAFYRNFPLLVITADRPQRWIGQMDGQTLPQPNAYGSMAALSVSLPEPTDEESRWYCNRLINEALIAQQRTHRPVQINIPITEPMFDFSEPSLPHERLIHRHDNATPAFTLSTPLLQAWQQSSRTLIIVGQMLPEEMRFCAPLLQQLAQSGCAIYAENLSNIHLYCSKDIYSSADLPQDNAFTAAPDLIITIGGHIVSKTLKQHIRKNPPQHHWHISPLGEVADLFMHCTDIIETTPLQLLSALCQLSANQGKQYTLSHYGLTYKPLTVSTFHQTLTTVLSALSPDWHIQVANSTMVRALQQLYSGTNPIHCNRGVNGIEGSSSAAVGYCTGSNAPTILLTGDLSFFYDQNALWNAYAKNPSAPLRILLLNNGCGDIFHHLPGLKSPCLDSNIAAAHTTTAEGIAHECGAEYLYAQTDKALILSLPLFLTQEAKTVILEVFV